MSDQRAGVLGGLLDKLGTAPDVEQMAVAADDEHRAHLARIRSERVPQLLAHLAATKPDPEA